MYCRYEASVQDITDGILRMHRLVNTEDVEAFTSHMPTREVEMKKEEDIVYKKGILSHAREETSIKLLGRVMNKCMHR